jgi:hypothetical protein
VLCCLPRKLAHCLLVGDGLQLVKPLLVGVLQGSVSSSSNAQIEVQII